VLTSFVACHLPLHHGIAIAFPIIVLSGSFIVSFWAVLLYALVNFLVYRTPNDETTAYSCVMFHIASNF